MLFICIGLYVPYGWSGGGGSISHMFIGILMGALYSLELGLFEHFRHESSDIDIDGPKVPFIIPASPRIPFR